MIGDGGESRGRRPGVGGIVGGGMRYDGWGTRSGEGGTRYEVRAERLRGDVERRLFFWRAAGHVTGTRAGGLGPGAGDAVKIFHFGKRGGKWTTVKNFHFGGREREWTRVGESGRKWAKAGESGREWTTVKNFHGNNGRVWKVLDGTRCGRWKVLDETRCGRWKVLDGTERVGGRRGDGCSKKNG